MDSRRAARAAGIAGGILVVILPLIVLVLIAIGSALGELDAAGADPSEASGAGLALTLGLTLAMGLPIFLYWATIVEIGAVVMAAVAFAGVHWARSRPRTSAVLLAVAGLLGLSPLLLLGHGVDGAHWAQIADLPGVLLLAAACLQWVGSRRAVHTAPRPRSASTCRSLRPGSTGASAQRP